VKARVALGRIEPAVWALNLNAQRARVKLVAGNEPMSKKKSNPNPGPRRHRFRRMQRLQSAKNWLLTYTGNKLIKAYRRRYGVDWHTAFTELEMLGIPIDPVHKEQVLRTMEQQAAQKRQCRLDAAEARERALGIDQDEHFAFIMGYTSGGAPYGITWEEWNTGEEDEDDV
jgi:hypothetical protein